MLGSINFNKLKNKVKIDKTKFKKNILTIGLSFIIVPIFSSDGISKDSKINSNQEISFDETTYEKIYTKEEICEEYSLFFKQYQIDYDLEEYFITKEEFNNLLATLQIDSKCEYVSNYNSADLIDTIKNNSLKYVNENSDYQSAFIEYTYGTDDYNEELYTDQLNFEIFLNKAINVFLENATNDVNEDIHKMQTLKFVYGTTSQDSNYVTLGYYDEKENLIVLSRDCIDLVATSYGKKPEYVLYSTIQHELNHVRQCKCDCRIKEENSWNKISYDGTSVPLIIESSAESEIYNLDKQLPFVKTTTYDYNYSEERQNETLLFLLALFNEKTNIENYYNAIFDTDLNSLLNFFDLETQEEKYTFLKLLYILDASKCRNDLPFLYYTNEEIENGITLQQLQFDLGYSYKSEIFKVCLTKLIEYTKNNEDFEFIDNLLIFNIIKNKVVDGSYKLELNIEENEYERMYNESFVNEVLELENKYVKFLSKYYEIDINKIREIEDSEIYWYGYCATNLSVGKANVYTKGYEEYAQKLLERFPILKAILYTDYYYTESYENFIEENNLKQKIYILN